MENHKNCKIWGVVLLALLLSSCGLFRKIDKMKYTESFVIKEDSVSTFSDTSEVLTEIQQRVVAVEHSTKSEKIKIYPKGSFSYSDGVFIGEADSIVSDKKEAYNSTIEMLLKLDELRKNYQSKTDSTSHQLSGTINVQAVKKEPSSSNWPLYAISLGVLFVIYLVARFTNK